MPLRTLQARNSIKFMVAVCIPVLLTGCAELSAFRQLVREGSVESSSEQEPLHKKCPKQEAINSWTTDCLVWKREQSEAAEAKRRSDAAARDAARAEELATYKKQQELKAREEREAAAKQSDERAGYKSITFEDFALDAKKMQGTKVVMHGIYVDKGQRLAGNPLAALLWIERSQSTKGAVIPLITEDATRDARVQLLRCAQSLVGCAIVVRGRVQMLTLRNAFGAESRELGVVVESVR